MSYIYGISRLRVNVIVGMKHNSMQRIFVAESYIRTKSHEKCRKFTALFPGGSVPSKASISES